MLRKFRNSTVTQEGIVYGTEDPKAEGFFGEPTRGVDVEEFTTGTVDEKTIMYAAVH